MYKAIDYVENASSLEVANYLVKHFTGSDVNAVASSLTNYKNVDTWSSDMLLTKPMFESLLSIIKNAGENVDGITFNNVVDNSLAMQVYKEL